MTTTEQLKITVWAEGRGFRAEPESFNGRALARKLLSERLGVPCFGKMRYPEMAGSFSVVGTTEEEALAKAEDVAAEYHRRVTAAVDQLVSCATCPYSESCWRLTMASKQYTT